MSNPRYIFNPPPPAPAYAQGRQPAYVQDGQSAYAQSSYAQTGQPAAYPQSGQPAAYPQNGQPATYTQAGQPTSYAQAGQPVYVQGEQPAYVQHGYIQHQQQPYRGGHQVSGGRAEYSSPAAPPVPVAYWDQGQQQYQAPTGYARPVIAPAYPASYGQSPGYAYPQHTDYYATASHNPNSREPSGYPRDRAAAARSVYEHSLPPAAISSGPYSSNPPNALLFGSPGYSAHTAPPAFIPRHETPFGGHNNRGRGGGHHNAGRGGKFHTQHPNNDRQKQQQQQQQQQRQQRQQHNNGTTAQSGTNGAAPKTDTTSPNKKKKKRKLDPLGLKGISDAPNGGGNDDDDDEEEEDDEVRLPKVLGLDGISYASLSTFFLVYVYA